MDHMTVARTKKGISKIRKERLKKGWRIEDLACFSRVGYAEISKYERCVLSPHPGHRQRIAAVLGLKPEELQEEVVE